MSLTPLSNTLLLRVIEDDDDQSYIAKITPDVTQYVKNIRLFLYINGSPGSNLQLQLHTSQNTSDAYASSNLIDLGDAIEGAKTLTFLRFDFSEEVLKASLNYYLTLKTEGYTRGGNVNFIATIYDYPDTINEVDSPTDIFHYTKAFQLFAYEVIS